MQLDQDFNTTIFIFLGKNAVFLANLYVTSNDNLGKKNSNTVKTTMISFFVLAFKIQKLFSYEIQQNFLPVKYTTDSLVEKFTYIKKAPNKEGPQNSQMASKFPPLNWIIKSFTGYNYDLILKDSFGILNIRAKASSSSLFWFYRFLAQIIV